MSTDAPEGSGLEERSAEADARWHEEGLAAYRRVRRNRVVIWVIALIVVAVIIAIPMINRHDAGEPGQPEIGPLPNGTVVNH